MTMTLEKWLLTHRKRDENVEKGEVRIKDIQQEVRHKIVEHFEETKEQTWCKCDTCTLIRLKAEDEKIIDTLAFVGLEYLLGENFNSAAALYYYSYAKDNDDTKV